jgi:hypothetical protein
MTIRHNPKLMAEAMAKAEAEYGALLTLGKGQNDPNKETPWQRQQREKRQKWATQPVPTAQVM